MCRTARIWSHNSIHGSNELEVEEIIANEPATLEQIFVAEMHPEYLLFRLQSWPLVNHQKQRMIIAAGSLERYERLYSGYKRRRSSYKGCSGPRSGSVYEVDLLARETPLWARPALDPHSCQ
jgi:hypothetical protein